MYHSSSQTHGSLVTYASPAQMSRRPALWTLSPVEQVRLNRDHDACTATDALWIHINRWQIFYLVLYNGEDDKVLL